MVLNHATGYIVDGALSGMAEQSRVILGEQCRPAQKTSRFDYTVKLRLLSQ